MCVCVYLYVMLKSIISVKLISVLLNFLLIYFLGFFFFQLFDVACSFLETLQQEMEIPRIAFGSVLSQISSCKHGCGFFIM